MIVVNNGRAFGCTPFFPGVLSNGRAFKVVELGAARRYAVWCVAIHLFFIFAGMVERGDPVFINNWSAMILFYVVVRIVSRRRVLINVDDKVSLSLAPVSIWLDHFSCFIMLLFCLLVTNNYFMPPYGFIKIISVISVVVVLTVGLSPAWSYFLYKKRVAHKSS
ncbi:hypothetical protein [Frateuria defendens]|uniref:hypothetical protein n=1 Tax=Frateuria defendens TaxID=2219559 RepID=UPI001292D949|nr:hypothetical protein [Frateuria defendens]